MPYACCRFIGKKIVGTSPKNFSTAESSHDGEFDTSTTTDAPFSTSASPAREGVHAELGDAATASCPCSRNLLTSFEPMSPVPPITMIFINCPFMMDPRTAERSVFRNP